MICTVTRSELVARTAAALIAAHLLIRAILVFCEAISTGTTSILIGRAGTQELLSPSFLFDDHDGQGEGSSSRADLAGSHR